MHALWNYLADASHTKFHMRIFLIFVLLVGGLGAWVVIRPQHEERKINIALKAEVHFKLSEKHIISYARQAKVFVGKRNYNKDICFFVDMSIPSGSNRFFIYDLKHDSILHAALVSHGSGSQTTTGKLIFSNEIGSLATSLGKYQVSNSYLGKFGLAYKLNGLDASNSNAYARAVVLHAHQLVPAKETYPNGICLSWGCPTVNPDFLQLIKKYIDRSDRSILLWIYD